MLDPTSVNPPAGAPPHSSAPPRADAPPNSSAPSNFAALTSLDWQVHVYGEPARELPKACDDWGIRLHVFEWQASMETAGLRRNAVYVIRPDGYIGLADAQGGAPAIDAYLHHCHVRITNEKENAN
jgi:hypothetical protein